MSHRTLAWTISTMEAWDLLEVHTHIRLVYSLLQRTFVESAAQNVTDWRNLEAGAKRGTLTLTTVTHPCPSDQTRSRFVWLRRMSTQSLALHCCLGLGRFTTPPPPLLLLPLAPPPPPYVCCGSFIMQDVLFLVSAGFSAQQARVSEACAWPFVISNSSSSSPGCAHHHPYQGAGRGESATQENESGKWCQLTN